LYPDQRAAGGGKPRNVAFVESVCDMIPHGALERALT